MSEATTADIVRRHIAEQSGFQAAPDDKRLAEDLQMDSLDRVKLTMAIEDEFNLELPDDELDGLKTVGEVIAYVVAKAD